MIDTHCHLLHGLDDGPATLPESLRLAQALRRAGVTEVTCTPHFSRRYPVATGDSRAALEELRGAIEAEGIELAISLAAELSPAMALSADPGELQARMMGNGYLLVELEPDTPAGIVELVLERLDGLGLLPVLGHPERCRAVRSQPHILDAARSAGAMVQVVARSLGRSPSRGAAEAAWALLEAGRADLIASDAHRPEHAEALSGVLGAVADRYGEVAVESLTVTAPSLLRARGGR